MLLHPGSHHNSILYEEIMTDLKRQRIIRIGGIEIFDKGYYLYGNWFNRAGEKEWLFKAKESGFDELESLVS
jgi:hypothetical protein